MDIHKNARLTPKGRERIVRQVLSGQTPKAAAFAVGVCPRTVRKWLTRYSIEGLAGLEDRSSRPRRLRQPTPLEVIEKIERLRRQRLTGKQIAAEAGVAPATVSRVLRRLGLNKLCALEPSLFAATSVRIRANSSMSIPRSSAGSAPSAIGSQDDKPAWSIATSVLAGSSSMSASTMRLASPLAG